MRANRKKKILAVIVTTGMVFQFNGCIDVGFRFAHRGFNTALGAGVGDAINTIVFTPIISDVLNDAGVTP